MSSVTRASEPRVSFRSGGNLGTLGLIALGAGILFLFMGVWRPIWLDELFHFALGGMDFEYAVKTIDYTTIEVGFGQTGVYIFFDWALMQLFGASSVALRLPSLVSTAMLLTSAVVFIRAKGYGLKWQYLMLLALASHSFLMWFTAEARPYMPLAASTTTLLAYYALPLSVRHKASVRLFALFGFTFGSVMHPYWILMAPLVALFSLSIAVREGTIGGRPRDLLRFINPWFMGTSLVLYLVVGQLTWMRKSIYFGFDPLYIMKTWSAVVTAFFVDHFTSTAIPLPIWPILISVTVLVIVVVRPRGASALFAPVILILIALASSAVISAMSIRSGYWVLERQWVAGMALSAIGSVWFFATLFRLSARRFPLALEALVVAFVAVTLLTFSLVVSQQLHSIADDRRAQAVFHADSRTPEELSIKNEGNDAVYSANVNIARGGRVWQDFISWYNREAGMRPEFRDKNPSWTKFIWPNPSPLGDL